MRKLTLQAKYFDNFVFPQLAGTSAENDSEWETALRLLKAIKDPVLTVEVDLTPQEKEARDRGQQVYAFRKLREGEATFLLQSDEYALLLKRINAHKTRVALVAAEDFAELLAAIENAPEVKVEEAVEETAEVES